MEKIILQLKKHYRVSYKQLADLLGLTERQLYYAKKGQASKLTNNYLHAVWSNTVYERKIKNLTKKIEKLIYLAAYLIPNGKTQAEYSALDTQGVLKPYVTRIPETNSHILQPEIYKEGLYHDCDNDISEMAKYILSNESVATGITPFHSVS